LLTKQTNTDKL